MNRKPRRFSKQTRINLFALSVALLVFAVGCAIFVIVTILITKDMSPEQLEMIALRDRVIFDLYDSLHRHLIDFIFSHIHVLGIISLIIILITCIRSSKRRRAAMAADNPDAQQRQSEEAARDRRGLEGERGQSEHKDQDA
jgi:ABC-type uncharacterized transport system permease subunit